MANIVLLGKSGSGKSSIERLLSDNLKYEKIISCTTRPKRENEIDGKDYYFIDDNKFFELYNDNKFIEIAVYNDWKYGILKSELDNKENFIVSLSPARFKEFKNFSTDFISFYVDTSDKNRVIRLAKRKDNIKEITRRFQTDEYDFKNIENEINYVVNNDDDIMSCVNEILFDVLYDSNGISLEEFYEELENNGINGEIEK